MRIRIVFSEDMFHFFFEIFDMPDLSTEPATLADVF